MPQRPLSRKSPRRSRVNTLTSTLVAVLAIGMLSLAIYVWLRSR